MVLFELVSIGEYTLRTRQIILQPHGALTNRVVTLTAGHVIKNSFFIGYGVLLILPWRKISGARLWKKLFILFSIASIVFPFVLIFQVMFYFMDMAELSQKPAAPAMEGTLIFLGLMQLPTVLFVRKPELLD